MAHAEESDRENDSVDGKQRELDSLLTKVYLCKPLTSEVFFLMCGRLTLSKYISLQGTFVP